MSVLPVRDRIRLWGKRLLFPGLDLHTRSRYRFLTRYFREGPIDTLDAGCGNGALSYAAYLRGNRVLGVTMDSLQVEKADEYFSFLGTDPIRLKFKVCNLYDLPRDQGEIRSNYLLRNFGTHYQGQTSGCIFLRRAASRRCPARLLPVLGSSRQQRKSLHRRVARLARPRRLHDGELPGAPGTGGIPDRQERRVWFAPFGEDDEYCSARVEPERRRFRAALVSSLLAVATFGLRKSQGAVVALRSVREEAPECEVNWPASLRSDGRAS